MSKQNIKLKPTWEWQARWTSYWYGDQKLFEFTPRDFDRRAAGLFAAGRICRNRIAGAQHPLLWNDCGRAVKAYNLK